MKKKLEIKGVEIKKILKKTSILVKNVKDDKNPNDNFIYFPTFEIPGMQMMITIIFFNAAIGVQGFMYKTNSVL